MSKVESREMYFSWWAARPGAKQIFGLAGAETPIVAKGSILIPAAV